MHRFFFSRLGLCEEASETVPATTTGAPVETPPAVEAPAASISIVDRAKALFKSSPQLQAELTQARATITAERDTFKAQLATLTAERDTFKAQVTEFKALLDTAEKENKDVQREVIHQLAAAGVPEAKLPAAVGAAARTGDGTDAIASLREELAAEKDPAAAGKIIAKIQKLKAQAAAVGLN